jgi:transcriptional regulator with XRE-family HTH domain/HEPN domain-containing protein
MARHKLGHVDDPAAVGERIRRAREERGLTQRELAFPGCSSAYISRIEAGARTPSLQVLRELATRLHVSEDYLAHGRDTPPPPRPSFLTDAEIALRLDDIPEAEALYARTLAEADDDRIRSLALEGLGQAALRTGRTAEAVDLLSQALELSGRAPHERPALAESLARAQATLGDLPPAIALLERCVAAFADGSDPIAFVRFSCLLAYALTDNGDFPAAERVLANALDVGRAVADPYTRARLYWAQARLAGEEGMLEIAERYGRKTLDTLRATEDTYAIAHMLETLAHLYLDMGRPEDAAPLLDEGFPLIAAAGTPVEIAHFQIERARELAATGHSEEAAALALEASARFRDAKPVDAGRAYELLAEVAERIGQPERALELYELAVETLEELPPSRYLLATYRRLADLLKRMGKTDEALTVLERAIGTQDRARNVAET